MHDSHSTYDAVDRIEGAVRRVMHESRGRADANQSTVVSGLVAELVQDVSESQRRSVLDQLGRRNPDWFGQVVEKGGNAPGSKSSSSSIDDRARLATVNREKRDLLAEKKELRNLLEAAKSEADRLSADLTKRSSVHRALSKEHQDLELKLRTRTKELQRARGEVETLERQLHEAVRDKERHGEKIIQQDTRLRAAEAVDKQAAAESVAAADSAQLPRPAPEPMDAPASTTYDEFIKHLLEVGKVQSDELTPITTDRERRLGQIAGRLVTFQSDVEKATLAQMDEISRRQPSLREYADDLRHFQRTERTWWWSLTHRAGRQVDPVRHFALYMSEIGRLNYVLLTAYFALVSSKMEDLARGLTDPVEIRKRAETRRPDELWKYYETEACNRIPNELADACQAEVAKVVAEMYGSRSD